MQPAWGRRIAAVAETDTSAWLVIGSVPMAAFFSFSIPALADAALAVMAFGGVVAILRGERSLPVVAALVWIGFVLTSAAYATGSGFPGRHFGSIGKHIPLALGPLAALSLYPAAKRLDLTVNDLLVLLLGGIVAGAALVLVRNGALSAVLGMGFTSPEGFFGAVNRNYAGLACGLLIVAATGLAFQLPARMAKQPLAAGGTIVVLVVAIVASILLLRVLQSRTALLATAVSVAAWLSLMFGASMKRRSSRIRMLGYASPILLVALAAMSAMLFQRVSERPLLEGRLAAFAVVAPAILDGRLAENADVLATAETRLQLVAVAIDLIRQAPWLGWGPDVSGLIATASPFEGLKDLNQFHNGYLQEVVSFGLVGSLLVLVLLGAVIRSAFNGYQRRSPANTLSSTLFATTLALVLYVAITNVTETILFVKPCAVLCVILAALACFPTASEPADSTVRLSA